jgi:hypothetical protein
MNEQNEMDRSTLRSAATEDGLEAQLRCWRPRRPSATLERRLFRRERARPMPAMVAGWLAPTAACLMFAGLILNPQSAATLSGSTQSGGLMALILSNQSYAAYLPGSFQLTHNQLETFAACGSQQAVTNFAQ